METETTPSPKFKIHLEHPRTWTRRISRVKTDLPNESPYVVKLEKAFKTWNGSGAIETPELLSALEKLEDSWLDALNEIERISKSNSERSRWRMTTTISLIALVAAISSTSVSAWFQYKNYQLNQAQYTTDSVKNHLKGLEPVLPAIDKNTPTNK